MHRLCCSVKSRNSEKGDLDLPPSKKGRSNKKKREIQYYIKIRLKRHFFLGGLPLFWDLFSPSNWSASLFESELSLELGDMSSNLITSLRPTMEASITTNLLCTFDSASESNLSLVSASSYAGAGAGRVTLGTIMTGFTTLFLKAKSKSIFFNEAIFS